MVVQSARFHESCQIVAPAVDRAADRVDLGGVLLRAEVGHHLVTVRVVCHDDKGNKGASQQADRFEEQHGEENAAADTVEVLRAHQVHAAVAIDQCASHCRYKCAEKNDQHGFFTCLLAAGKVEFGKRTLNSAGDEGEENARRDQRDSTRPDSLADHRVGQLF